MFGQKLKTLEALVDHYEALFAAAGFDTQKAAEGDKDALKNFIAAQKPAGGNAPDNSAAIVGALQEAGLKVEGDATPENVSAAVTKALTAAEAKGGAEAGKGYAKAVADAGVKVEGDVSPDNIKAALDKKVSAEVAAKIAANGHEPLEQQPAAGATEQTAEQMAEAINAETDPVKKAELYQAYAKKYLPALG